MFELNFQTYIACALVSIILMLCFAALVHIFEYQGSKYTSVIFWSGIVFILSVVVVACWYPEHSIEYQKGYNDFPDDSTYNDAKIIKESKTLNSPYHWYCNGWEAARVDATEGRLRTIDDVDTEAVKNSIYS